MEVLRDVKEGNIYGDCLFFNFRSFENNIVKYAFFPRPYDGRDYLEGFAFAWEEKEEDNNWEYFYNTVLLNPEFIKCFWVEYRLGFNPDKYWFKIIDEFKRVYDDCPYETSAINFGKKPLPPEYVETVKEKTGIDIFDMHNYKN